MRLLTTLFLNLSTFWYSGIWNLKLAMHSGLKAVFPYKKLYQRSVKWFFLSILLWVIWVKTQNPSLGAFWVSQNGSFCLVKCSLWPYALMVFTFCNVDQLLLDQIAKVGWVLKTREQELFKTHPTFEIWSYIGWVIDN